MARDPHQLREEAASAVARGKFEVALALYGELETLEPTAAAWPKRVGETYRRMGNTKDAVGAFERAVDKYVRDGLLVQAIAVCKLILQIDPKHASTAARLAELATPTPAEARAVRKPQPAPLSTPAVEMARRAAATGDDKQARRIASDPRREDVAPASRAALLEQPAVGRVPTGQPAAARTSTSDTPPPAVGRTSTSDTSRVRSGDAPAPPAVGRTSTSDSLRIAQLEAAARGSDPAIGTSERVALLEAAARAADARARVHESKSSNDIAVARVPTSSEPIVVARTSSQDMRTALLEAAARARTPSEPPPTRRAPTEPPVSRRAPTDPGLTRPRRASTDPGLVAHIPTRDKPPTHPDALLDAAIRRTDDTEPLAPRTSSENEIRISPAAVAHSAAVRRSVALPMGGGLDAIPLAMVMPDSQRVRRADGTDAGMSLLRIDVDFDDVDDQVEIEVVDPHRMALLKTPVFAQLPPAALERLIGQLELRELFNGEELFHEGDAGATMFVVSEGEVEVASYGQELATLGPGAFFGEISLITDLPRSATIRAKGKVELLALGRDVVRTAAIDSPEIVTALLSFVRERLVDRVARTSPLFRPFSENERAQLAARFEVIEVDAGAQLITVGEKADGLYVVLAGKVDVSRGTEGSLATLSCGDVFGEMSLMGNRGSTANVHAITRVLALRLPAKVFQEIIVTYPQVLEFLGDLTSSRSRLRRAEEFLDLHITLV